MPQGTKHPSGRDDTRRGSARNRQSDRGLHSGRKPGEELVLVQFKGHRTGFYHNRRQIPLAVGRFCLVEADRGKDMGRITYIGPGKLDWWRHADRQGVLAEATPGDLERLHENRGDEWEFWDICQEKIQARRLKMDLVTVERQFDHNKITFYFTAERRVDFRELVRDLAAIFRTRIELRQIGVRDDARLKGGIGVCGREFCCSTFLHQFVPVTLKMAKEQQLPMNPGKLSGPCGRLRCCLTYEYADYREVLDRLPRVGTRVRRDGEEGQVRKLDLVQETITVYFDQAGESIVCTPDQLTWQRGQELPRPLRTDRTALSGRRRNGNDNAASGRRGRRS